MAAHSVSDTVLQTLLSVHLRGALVSAANPAQPLAAQALAAEAFLTAQAASRTHAAAAANMFAGAAKRAHVRDSGHQHKANVHAQNARRETQNAVPIGERMAELIWNHLERE